MTQSPLWVFGYGSLLWHPGFEVAERCPARLDGYRRSFCMRSVHHRGTVAQPGLVLALDPVAGASCEGIALRAAEGAEAETHAYLRDRELVTDAYLERWARVALADGRAVTTLAYVMDTAHPQYCGGMPAERQAETIARATGARGPNTEYLHNTAAHLAELGIEDREIAWLDRRVRALTGPAG